MTRTPGGPVSEQPNPYGAVPTDAAAPGAVPLPPPRRVRVHHLREMKRRGEKFAMLTAYEQYSASIFEEAGIPVLLVGDSAANNVLGYETTVPVTVEELLPAGACGRAAPGAPGRGGPAVRLVQSGPDQALATAMRMMKEGGAHAVKLEGGAGSPPASKQLVGPGIPGDGPHRVHPASRTLDRRVPGPGRGETSDGLPGRRPRRPEAGAFAVVLEMVTASAATRRSPTALEIPTIGIGAGPTATARYWSGRT